MTTDVSVREFAHNPSAMFARAENGETLKITKHGKVIATLVPTSSLEGVSPELANKYQTLIDRGVIKRLGSGRPGDIDSFTHYEAPSDVDPLAILFKMREEEEDRALPGFLRDSDSDA